MVFLLGTLGIVELPKFKCQNISKMEHLEYLINWVTPLQLDASAPTVSQTSWSCNNTEELELMHLTKVECSSQTLAIFNILFEF